MRLQIGLIFCEISWKLASILTEVTRNLTQSSVVSGLHNWNHRPANKSQPPQRNPGDAPFRIYFIDGARNSIAKTILRSMKYEWDKVC